METIEIPSIGAVNFIALIVPYKKEHDILVMKTVTKRWLLIQPFFRKAYHLLTFFGLRSKLQPDTLTPPSMDMSSNSMPLDIIFEVTRSLFKEDDHATLSNMSVTCRAVLPFCRARLFYSIELLLRTSGSNESAVITRLQNLNTLFINNAILSTYVREFKFGNAPSSGSELLWFINKPELPRLLDSLSQLITFTMVGSLRLMIDWAEFDEELKRACFRARARPTLKKLYLSSIENAPWGFVTEPVQLYHLSVCEITLDLEPTSEPPPPAPQRFLKTFSYGYCEGTLLLLFERARFDFTKLERLNVDPDDMNDINTGWAIARLAKETLESFEIFPPDSYPYRTPPLFSSCVPC